MAPKQVTIDGETYRARRTALGGGCSGCAADAPDARPGLCADMPNCTTPKVIWVRDLRPGHWPDMTPFERHVTLQNMENRGGSFARSIAHAFMAADSANTARLAAAFPELVAAYAPNMPATTSPKE